MGINPVNDKYTVGDDCSQCKSVIFDEETPTYVEANVQGMIKCPFAIADPPNGVHLLTQNPVVPCLWGGLVGSIGISWFLFGGNSTFQIAIAGTLLFFQHQTANPCDKAFTNQLAICGGDVQALGGTCEIFWGPTIGP